MWQLSNHDFTGSNNKKIQIGPLQVEICLNQPAAFKAYLFDIIIWYLGGNYMAAHCNIGDIIKQS